MQFSLYQDISASLCFRGQRIFLHNASGRFGDVPLEASGDFGIHPEEGEFHVMCQVCSWIWFWTHADNYEGASLF